MRSMKEIEEGATMNGSDDTEDKQLGAREHAVATRERALKDRERHLESRARELKDREAELEATKARLQRTDTDLGKRQRQVADAESALEGRTRDVAQREIEASAGFAAQNRQALAELTQAHAALRAEAARVQAEIDAARLESLAGLDQRLADERRSRTAALDAELQAERDRHHASLASERARSGDDQRAALDAMRQQRAKLDADDAELRHGQRALEWAQDEVERARRRVEDEIENRTRERVGSLEHQLDELRKDYQTERDLRIELQRRIDEEDSVRARTGDDPASLLRRIDDAAQQITRLQNELLQRPSASDKELLVQLQAQARVWASERDGLVRDNTRLKAEQGRWLTSVDDLERQRERREVAERRLEALSATIDKYKEDVDRLRSLSERPEERAARVEAIEAPWRLDFTFADDKPVPELDWLAGIVAACEQSGLRFPRRLVHAFHTSLKASELSPLAVLAGVSGTGKSELPRLYARFGGLGFLSLAVQPNWDTPQSLFGFFNSIDNRFNATTLLRAMVQAQHDPNDESYRYGISDRLLLVLLDEMNLAYVEQYFSDLLSRLEQRRGETRDVTLDIDLGAGMAPYELRLGRNVLWVGTMNEDETTKALSDKVIDRSNLLYFPRPRTLHSRAEVTLAPEAALIDTRTWARWVQRGSPFTAEEIQPFRERLERINHGLEHVGRALGHRVWQSVECYLANHPEVIDARVRRDPDALARAMTAAYEDQLVLKVMPKLRGIETTGDSKRNCLDVIRKEIEGLGLSEDFHTACRVGHGAFVWSSARYLESEA